MENAKNASAKQRETAAESALDSKVHRNGLDDATLLKLYRGMLYPRMIEEKMLKLLRQGKISKWFSGIGQEAIAVGATLALQEEEYIFPMHRNLGVFTSRNISLQRLVAQWQGKAAGFTKGRDRSFHFGTREYHIVGMISHLAAQLSLCAGTALAHKLDGEKKISLAFTGEGGTSEGEFHEALNLASVWSLPCIFLIENNGYGLSTPINEQYNCDHLVQRAMGYGMEGHRIDGNNVVEVYKCISELAADIRENPRPVLVECNTFRMRGHEEASGTKYISPALFEIWEQRDPIQNLKDFLLSENILSEEDDNTLRAKFKEEIAADVSAGMEMPDLESTVQRELADVYHPTENSEVIPETEGEKMRFIDAISAAFKTGMQRHRGMVLMGQDIAEYGGVFKITKGFVEEFGKERVRNTPICESAVIGAGMGLSIAGRKSVVEMQFSDFVTCGFNQIVNNVAKSHYRWGQNADLVIRMPTGGGVGAGPFHSQSTEAWFAHTAGLQLVYPSNPRDAKGLLLAAMASPNPVLYYEHKALYRAIEGEVPEGYYTVPIGKAAIRREGSSCTIITYGMGVIWAEQLLDDLELDVEILDLRTLQPLDYEAIRSSVTKTNRALILHEDVSFGGLGGEIASWISEEIFEHLDAPVRRVASLDTPVPFNVKLEKEFLAKHRLQETLEELLAY